MSERALRAQLEETHGRLRELEDLKARGFDLPLVQEQLLATLTAQTHRVTQLEAAVGEAAAAEGRERQALLEVVEGHRFRNLSPLQHWLMGQLDGGKLLGTLGGTTAAATLLLAMANGTTWPWVAAGISALVATVHSVQNRRALDDAQREQALSEQAPSEQAPSEQAPSDQAPSGQAPSDRAPSEQA